MSNSNVVHQNRTMGLTNSYTASTLFNNLLSANVSNISDAVQILQPIPASIPLKFRTLPFYKLKYEILKPSAMSKLYEMLRYNICTILLNLAEIRFSITSILL